MFPDINDSAADRVDLADLLGEMSRELRCLLGPVIRLETANLAGGGSTQVRVRPPEIVDLLRHLALDALDAMPAGGTVAIRTGRLGAVPDCAAIVIHEIPNLAAPAARHGDERIRKGRSLGLEASYNAIEHAGGHLHVSCRGRETVLTICFPLA